MRAFSAILLVSIACLPLCAQWSNVNGDPVINPDSGEVINPFVWYDADSGLVFLNAMGQNGLVDSVDNNHLLFDDVGMIGFAMTITGQTEVSAELPFFADGIAWDAPEITNGRLELLGVDAAGAFLPVTSPRPIFRLDAGLNRLDFGLDANGDPTSDYEPMRMNVNYRAGVFGRTLFSENPIDIRNEVFDVSADLNNDGNFDCLDIDALGMAIVEGNSNSIYDLNNDGSVSVDDLTLWRALLDIPSGDANLSGSVDTSDFNIWNGNKFTTTTGWCSGDFTTDGSVDASDFNAWNANKFTSNTDGPVAVPEPGLVWPLLICLAFLQRFLRSDCSSAL